MSAAGARDGPAEQALHDLGVRCTVEARGPLAIVVADADERALEDAATRRAVVAALRARGFTHAAVELSRPDERPAPTVAPPR